MRPPGPRSALFPDARWLWPGDPRRTGRPVAALAHALRVRWWLWSPACGLHDVPVPQNGAAHETWGRLVQGDVCARVRGRWLGMGLTGNGSPTAIHPAPTVTPVPSAAMVTPASTLQDVPVSCDRSPEDFAGVPELLDFALPGSDDSHHESSETGCALGIPHAPILQDTASTAQALSSTGGPKIRVAKSSEDSQSP